MNGAVGGEPRPGVEAVRLTAFVRGRVQGVGFRWWVRSQALELGLAGYARNLPDRRVEVVAQGPAGAVSSLLERLEEMPSSRHRPGFVAGVSAGYGPARDGVTGFAER